MPRPIQIDYALNGYVCQVGCQRVVFMSAESLTSTLLRYLKNPEQTEKEFQDAAVNPMLGLVMGGVTLDPAYRAQQEAAPPAPPTGRFQ